MIWRLSLLVALLLVAAVARAQPEPEGQTPPTGCEPRMAEDFQHWRDWFAMHGPGFPSQERGEEARRIGDSRGVFRYLDRLYLARDDGGVVTLIDCVYGDGMYRYLYQGYDDVGGYFLVQRVEYEDMASVLISPRTGLTFVFTSVPLWSPDRKRFATGRCDALNGPDELRITRPSGEAFEREATIPLPCGPADCTFAWQGASEIEVSCANAQSGETTTFHVVRQGEAWSTAPN